MDVWRLALVVSLCIAVAGCAGGGTEEPEDVRPPPSTGATSTMASAQEEGPVPPAELFNRTFTYQTAASLPMEGFDVGAAWASLNLTAKLQNTSACYALAQETHMDGTTYTPSVTLTSPAGTQHEVELLTAAGCQPGSPVAFLEPVSLVVAAEDGRWTVTPRGWGANMDLRVVLVAAGR